MLLSLSFNHKPLMNSPVSDNQDTSLFSSLIYFQVTENKTPAAPPAGFVAIEPSSFQVALGVSKGAGLTLSKIDYVFDGTST